jgi:hypothetical protein
MLLMLAPGARRGHTPERVLEIRVNAAMPISRAVMWLITSSTIMRAPLSR